VSLEGQYAKHFPTQVWESINMNKQELEMLSNSWIWGSKVRTEKNPKSIQIVQDLKYIDIEAPDKILDRLITEGTYRPKLLYKNVMRRGQELKEAGLLEEGEKVSSLFEGEEMVRALAGEIPMEVPLPGRPRRGEDASLPGEDGRGGLGRPITREEVAEVETELEELCGSIVAEWDRRMIQTPLAKATCEGLGKPLNVDVDRMKELLNNILKELPEQTSEKYEVSQLLVGYDSFLKVFCELAQEKLPNEIYTCWYKEHAQDNEEFADFFECLQIRTSSEVGSQIYSLLTSYFQAFCETVGSIMTNHVGKGRYLRPTNFNMEIFLGMFSVKYFC
jgi:hypothetical protein